MSGSEAPIVLVHGLFGSLRDSRIVSAFGQAEVHAPDLIGYGKHADADVKNLTLSDQAAHVAGYIRLIGQKVHLVGHSIGGAVSALLCRSYPELVTSFTSVEGNFNLKDAFWSSQIAEKAEGEVAAIVDGYKADADSLDLCSRRLSLRGLLRLPEIGWPTNPPRQLRLRRKRLSPPRETNSIWPGSAR